jgi:separase
LLNEFDGIIAQSKAITASASSRKTKTAKEDWWDSRFKLDAALGDLLAAVEDRWFGAWRGVLRGEEVEEVYAESFRFAVDAVQLQLAGMRGKKAAPLGRHWIEVLLRGFAKSTEEQILAAFAWLFGWNKTPNDTSTPVKNKKKLLILKKCYSFLQDAAREIDSDTKTQSENEEEEGGQIVQRGPVVLIPCKEIQGLPFESLPSVTAQPMSRLPCMNFIAAHLATPMAAYSATSTFYLLNPGNDLPRTEKMFQAKFKAQKWSGVMGMEPSKRILAQALQTEQFYIYCGHSAGEQYLSIDEVKQLDIGGIALLMGCSSGHLKYERDSAYEPNGMALAYLIAGCPSVTANLWDVTDKDIDRLSQTLLESIAYAPRRASRTRKATSAASVTSADTDSARNGVDVLSAVNASRNACKLRYLNGASPVCYGVPVRMTKNTLK